VTPLLSARHANGKAQVKRGIVVGCPIPRKYFETSGKGESDYQVHAGSYHVALQQAGIERANIMAYSSIMPAIAQRIGREEGFRMIQHGAEMKVIQAAAHVDTATGNRRATAAIMYGLLYPKSGGPTIGGLVCEYNGSAAVEEAKANLHSCLDGLYRGPDIHGRRFSDEYELRDVRFLSETIEPKKRFGTALVVLAFVDYFVPVLEQDAFDQEQEEVALAVAEQALGSGL